MLMYHTQGCEDSPVHRTSEWSFGQRSRLDRLRAYVEDCPDSVFQRRGESGGNYIDMQTGESFWIQVFEDALEVSSRAYCLYWGSGKWDWRQIRDELSEIAGVPQDLSGLSMHLIG